MTGLRVGYLAAPAAISAAGAKLQEPLIACVNAPAQAAALAALRGPQDAVRAMRDTYRQRRDAAITVLEELGIRHLVPHGAFYLWIHLAERSGPDVAAWALELLCTERVAIAPGTAFGPVAEGWARLSLAADTDDLIEGIRRIGGRQ
ncbi:aminotransferase class I/II-fold pyridoxal phosphate-dependent enzyme [Pseudonocardia nigra]|uniref:aminotransferase class I/II-fold pyridoxal phosphate-dependent enzyme n=1 Tax=Pseudonocardia nigra TaxID=1921578 RepID=UPI001C5D12FB|nr:aminotransferase class I/II-fold pyridoxal phosphate-dependent enzyme [Pseudonocardia nigra]